MLVRTFFTSSRARGARRARAGHRTGIAPREATTACNTAQHPPSSWLDAKGNRAAPGAGCLPLALAGHVGASAHSPPRPDRTGQRAATPAVAREVTERRHPSGVPHCEALQDHGQGRTSSLRCGRSTLTVTLDRDSTGAYRRDG